MRKVLLLLMCVLAVSLFAATTGKVVGRVYDASTGEALPGVNVILEGTTMGAATDPDGYFVILNVTPGEYSVAARMMGYREVTITGVRVEADLTRTLEFALESEAIAVKGVTIKAKRPIIKKDVTTSVAIISADDMESTPVNTIEGVVARQAGVVDDGGTLHVRGGRSWEVVYVVDGVEMVDPMTGGFDSHIPQESVQETSVYTGGFGAEYGSAQSGVINVITKSGGSKIHFTLKARTNDAFGVEGLQKFLDNNESSDTTYLTATKSDTPTPYFEVSNGDTTYYNQRYDKITYRQAGSGNLVTAYATDTLVVADWQPEKMKRFDFTLSGPLVGKKLRFFLGGEYSSDDGHHPNYDDWEQTYTGKLTFKPSQAFKVMLHGLYYKTEYKNYNDQWKFNLDKRPEYIAESYSYGLNFTHAINPRMIHEFKFNNYTTSLLYNVFEDGTYDFNNDGVIDENDKDGIDDFFDEDNDRDVEINGVERGFDWPFLTKYPFTRLKNIDGYITSGYYRLTYGWDEKKVYTGKWDLTAQLGRIHEIKLGASGKYYDIFDYGADMASGGNIYMDWAESNPYRIAAYLQDKLEQESFVVNAGLRFDYFDAKGEYPADPTDPVWNIAFGGEIKNPLSSEPQWSLSPRVGFSFPITEYDKFHFTYGHYFQMPRMLMMFQNQNYDFSGVYTLVGNPNIQPMKTVSYEFGIQHAFNDEILLDITAYMKDISGLSDTEQIFYTMTQYYTRYTNFDYGSARGIEIDFSKRRGGTPAWLTWNMNYTFGVSRGKSSSYRQNYDYLWNRYVVPAEEHYLDWDQRHTVTANIGLQAPEAEALFGVPGLENFGVNFTVRYGSGLPWTPPSRTREQTINTERLPYTIRTDMRFYKDLKIGQLRLGLFGDIYHLFDHENIVRGYLDSDWYNAYGDPEGAYADPRVYSAKRFMRLGLSVKW